MTPARPHPEATWQRGNHGIGHINTHGDVVTSSLPTAASFDQARWLSPTDAYAHFIISPGGHVEARMTGPMTTTEFYRVLQHAHHDIAPKWTRMKSVPTWGDQAPLWEEGDDQGEQMRMANLEWEDDKYPRTEEDYQRLFQWAAQEAGKRNHSLGEWHRPYGTGGEAKCSECGQGVNADFSDEGEPVWVGNAVSWPCGQTKMMQPGYNDVPETPYHVHLDPMERQFAAPPKREASMRYLYHVRPSHSRDRVQNEGLLSYALAHPGEEPAYQQRIPDRTNPHGPGMSANDMVWTWDNPESAWNYAMPGDDIWRVDARGTDWHKLPIHQNVARGEGVFVPNRIHPSRLTLLHPNFTDADAIGQPPSWVKPEVRPNDWDEQGPPAHWNPYGTAPITEQYTSPLLRGLLSKWDSVLGKWDDVLPGPEFEEGEPQLQTCPACQWVGVPHLGVCPHCGHEYSPLTNAWSEHQSHQDDEDEPRPAHEEWMDTYGRGYTGEEPPRDPAWQEHLTTFSPGDRLLHQPHVEGDDGGTVPHGEAYPVIYQRPDPNYAGAHYVHNPASGETEWAFHSHLMPYGDIHTLPEHHGNEQDTMLGTCGACGGKGTIMGDTCPRCKGSGWSTPDTLPEHWANDEWSEWSPGETTSLDIACPKCGGVMNSFSDSDKPYESYGWACQSCHYILNGDGDETYNYRQHNLSPVEQGALGPRHYGGWSDALYRLKPHTCACGGAATGELTLSDGRFIPVCAKHRSPSTKQLAAMMPHATERSMFRAPNTRSPQLASDLTNPTVEPASDEPLAPHALELRDYLRGPAKSPQADEGADPSYDEANPSTPDPLPGALSASVGSRRGAGRPSQTRAQNALQRLKLVGPLDGNVRRP
jgi:hypothetical protein